MLTDKFFEKLSGPRLDRLLHMLKMFPRNTGIVAKAHPIAATAVAGAGGLGAWNIAGQLGKQYRDANDPGKQNMGSSLLQLAGLGLMGGAGVRLGQELLKRFTEKQRAEDDHNRTMTVDIFDPAAKRKHRGEPADETPAEDVTEKVSSMDEDWKYIPAFVAALGGGGALGYKGVQAVTDHLKKKELEDKLRAAKQEFEDAMYEQHAAGQQKMSAAGRLGQLMDQCFDQGQEKRAFFPYDQWSNTIGSTATGYSALLAALVFALSHKSTYEQMHKADPEVLYSKLLQKQRRQRQAVSPPPIRFQLAGEKRKPDVEEELESAAAPLDEDKFASAK